MATLMKSDDSKIRNTLGEIYQSLQKLSLEGDIPEVDVIRNYLAIKNTLKVYGYGSNDSPDVVIDEPMWWPQNEDKPVSLELPEQFIYDPCRRDQLEEEIMILGGQEGTQGHWHTQEVLTWDMPVGSDFDVPGRQSRTKSTPTLTSTSPLLGPVLTLNSTYSGDGNDVSVGKQVEGKEKKKEEEGFDLIELPDEGEVDPVEFPKEEKKLIDI